MRLQAMDDNLRVKALDWGGLISSIGEATSSVITSVKAPGGTVQTRTVTPVYSPSTVLGGESGNTLLLLGLGAIAIFFLMKR